MAKEFQLKIQPCYHLTLKELGLSVHDRTPHAGHLSKTSQAVVQEPAKAHLLVYTKNKIGDPTYRPRTVQINGEAGITAIGENLPAETLTPFAPVDHRSREMLAERLNAPLINEAKTLAQLHIAGMVAVWGETRVTPFDSLLIDGPCGEEVLRALATIPGACNRILTPNGTLENRPVSGPVDPESLVETTRSISESSTPGHQRKLVPGPVLSNESNVVSHAIARSLERIRDGSETEIQINHSSGPDMIKYTQRKDFQHETLRIARELAHRLDLKNAAVSVNIYPSSELRIAAPNTEQARKTFATLSKLIDLYLAYQGDGDSRNETILAAFRKHKIEVDEEGKVVTQARKHMNQLALDLSSSLSKVPGLNFQPRQLSQWDILANGRSLPVLPDAFSDLKVREIAYFTNLAEQFSQGKTQYPKKFPDGISEC